VFTEDRVVIKFLHKNKGYGQRWRLVKEFRLKKWWLEKKLLK